MGTVTSKHVPHKWRKDRAVQLTEGDPEVEVDISNLCLPGPGHPSPSNRKFGEPPTII